MGKNYLIIIVVLILIIILRQQKKNLKMPVNTVSTVTQLVQILQDAQNVNTTRKEITMTKNIKTPVQLAQSTI